MEWTRAKGTVRSYGEEHERGVDLGYLRKITVRIQRGVTES